MTDGLGNPLNETIKAVEAFAESADSRLAEATELLQSPDKGDQLKGQEMMQRVQELQSKVAEMLESGHEVRMEIIDNLSDAGSDVIEGEALADADTDGDQGGVPAKQEAADSDIDTSATA